MADIDRQDEIEGQRQQALQSYEIFGTTPEPQFDNMTAWLAALLRMPMAVISFVGADQVAVKSSFGFACRLLARSESLCRLAVEVEDFLIIHDPLNDSRARDSVLVTGDTSVRFYAAVPLTTPDGYRIGTISVADTVARPEFGETEIATLREMRRIVLRELDARRQVAGLLFQQILHAAIAEAPDFQRALETMLLRAGQRIGAAYCLVAQRLADPTVFNYLAGVTIQPAFQEEITRILQEVALPMTQSRVALASGGYPKVFDSGPLTIAQAPHYPEQAATMITLGVRRIIAVPFFLGSRRVNMLAGFTRPYVSDFEVKFLAELVVQLVPLLFGRMKEEALEHERLEMKQANRALRTLVGANQSLVVAATQHELAEQICQVAVTKGGYAAAWVGFARHDPERRIEVFARWGNDLGLPVQLPLTWADTPQGRGASGTAIRENRLVAKHKLAPDDHTDTYGNHPAFSELGSCIAVPLRNEAGEAIGVFTLYNLTGADPVAEADPRAFDPREEELLTELARDIVNGLNMIRDRDERDAARRHQAESDSRLAKLLAESSTVLFSLERICGRWECTEVTPNFERLTGHIFADTKQEDWWKTHTHPDDYLMAMTMVKRLTTEQQQVFQYRLADKNGGFRWIHTELNLVAAEGESDRILGSWLDVTEKREAQNKIHNLAYYDQLTGLANRELLKRNIERAAFDVEVAEDMRHFSALLFIDIDRFKAINDAHGHAVGDHVLISVAKRVMAGVRDVDTVARLGGDEFVVFMPMVGLNEHEASEHVQRVAGRLALAIDQEIELDKLLLRTSASIGVYVFPNENYKMEQILGAADMAMYAAKAVTKNHSWPLGASKISVFEPSMQDEVAQFHAMRGEIQRGLKENRFELWLQPQVDGNGMILGAEGLIRLRRANGELIQPDQFIPISEETGQIVTIGEWVRAEACRLLARYSKAQLPCLAANVSPIEFRQPNIVRDMRALLEQSGADPTRLKLEITESLLIEQHDGIINNLKKLSALGIRISIDDFGTGYSSLAYLQRLPINEIKIDKSFVQNMLSDRRGADLTKTLIMLARNFGFNIVAEGVETRAQAAFLRKHGCRMLQGYLFGRPHPVEVFFSESRLVAHEVARTL